MMDQAQQMGVRHTAPMPFGGGNGYIVNGDA
jgi:hypothetical protein